MSGTKGAAMNRPKWQRIEYIDNEMTRTVYAEDGKWMSRNDAEELIAEVKRLQELIEWTETQTSILPENEPMELPARVAHMRTTLERVRKERDDLISKGGN